MKKILVIVAHPDDEILGCGGTIAKYVKKGSSVSVLFLSDGEMSRLSNRINKKIFYRKKCALKAMKCLGVKKSYFEDLPDNSFDTEGMLNIVKKIEEYIKKINPDTILTHHYDDLNIDHQITSKAVITACRPRLNNSVNLILFFEILSSTEWNISSKKQTFRPNWFEDISRFINVKTRAMKCYPKELRKTPHSRSLNTIKALSVFRGSSAGLKYAEAFELGRKI